MQRSEIARANFMRGLNCCQSVFLAFNDVTGLDEHTALKISAPLGGGVGRMREICGAVSAMMLVLGIVFYDAEHPTAEEKSALYAVEQVEFMIGEVADYILYIIINPLSFSQNQDYLINKIFWFILV